MEHLAQSLGHLTADLPPAGVKIGALGNRGLAAVTGEFLGKWAGVIPIVWDPALVSSSGYPLFAPDALPYLHDEFLPAVGWVTPNWAELALLSGLPVESLEQAEAAAEVLGQRHRHLAVVVTGGDQAEPVDLLRMPDGSLHRFAGERVASTSTHGTGCAFSSALLSGLISGRSPEEAVARAKEYVTEAIRRAPGLGAGRGPLDLYWPLKL